MAIEKMNLAFCRGKIEQLDELIWKCCVNGQFHVENANLYISESMGFKSFNEENTYKPLMAHIRELASLAEIELEENNISEMKLIDSEFTEKINEFDEKVSKFVNIKKDLSDQKMKCETGISVFSNFIGLDADMDRIRECEFINVRFGRLPKESYTKLTIAGERESNSTDDISDNPYYLFLPSSEDSTSVWGAYFTPVEKSKETDRLFASLHFETVEMPGAAGTPSEIIENLKKDIEINDEQIREIDEDIKKDLSDQKMKCETGISVFSNFIGLDADMDRIRECEFINVRFGRLPKESYMKLTIAGERESNSTDDISDNPYYLFLPSSEDSTSVWGAYFTPVEKSKETDRLFASLHFETVEMPGAAGTPSEIIENLKKDIEIIDEQIREIDEDIKKDLSDQKMKCETGISVFSNFIGLDADMDRIRECEFINVRFGRLPKESYTKLTIAGERESHNSDDISNNPYYLFLPSSEDNTSVWGAYFTPVEKSKETDRLFASLHFETVEMPGAAGTPSEIIENLKKDIEIIDEQIREIDEDIKKFWEENREQCNNIYSVLCANDAMMEIKRHAVVSEGYFFLVGWVVKKHTKEIKFLVNRIEDVDVQFSKPEEDTTTTPPTKLKNLKIARPFEFFIDMYGLPSYNDVDITSFVAVTYMLMFGIMFGDLGQGLILMIVGMLMWKFKKMALGKALIPCGISAMFFGLVYGSVFGYEELLDPLYKAVGMKGKPISVLENVNTILIFAISIGIVLVAISIIINIYASFKRKSIGEAIFSQNGIAGLLFYLSAVNLAVNFMSKKAIIPIKLSVCILAVGAVILFMKEILIKLADRKPDWKPESVSDFIMQNIFELLEYVLSYASNTVSFLRVGAFVLVHAGMMMVVFNLAGESKNIFVIILGNALVIALEGLLTGIQAMRLEFYEMFSRFYEGDGRPFNGVNLREYKK